MVSNHLVSVRFLYWQGCKCNSQDLLRCIWL